MLHSRVSTRLWTLSSALPRVKSWMSSPISWSSTRIAM